LKQELFREIERLTVNAARRREELQVTGLHNAKRQKALTVIAGILALTSAGSIAAVMSKLFGDTAVQLIAAFTAGVSGTISLLIAAYYSDNAVFDMLLGSSKFLTLRENVYRLVIHPNMSDMDRFSRLGEFQAEYARLDEIYSRYFAVGRGHVGTNMPPPHRGAVAESVELAGQQERENLRKEFGKSATDSAPYAADPPQ
jgi:hypothetical protein